MNTNWRLEAISKAALARKIKSYPLKQGKNCIGKSSKNDIRIPSVLCSRNHCIIIVDDGLVSLCDVVRPIFTMKDSGVGHLF